LVNREVKVEGIIYLTRIGYGKLKLWKTPSEFEWISEFKFSI